MLNGLITAVRTLSIIPIPGKDAEEYSASLYWFVWIGALLGAISFFLIYLIEYSGIDWPAGTAVLVVAAGVILTRGLHLDGLADFADGFGGGYTKKRTLAIMKDTACGTFGIVAILLVLLTKWVALARLIEHDKAIWILAAFIISRSSMVELAVSLPYARENGTAASFVKGANLKHRIVTLLTAAILLYAIFGYLGILVIFLAWIFCRLFGMWCAHRVGGITGDLLGACSEMVETLVLFVVALL